MKKKIYLASPFFNNDELVVYRNAILKLRNADYEVYAPQEHEIENAWDLSNEDWARAVYREDVHAILNSDVVMILNFGMYSDSGTAWEAGYAYGMKIPTIQVLCGGENATYSLMMMNGCDKVIEFRQIAYWEENCACAHFDKIIQK